VVAGATPRLALLEELSLHPPNCLLAKISGFAEWTRLEFVRIADAAKRGHFFGVSGSLLTERAHALTMLAK